MRSHRRFSLLIVAATCLGLAAIPEVIPDATARVIMSKGRRHTPAFQMLEPHLKQTGKVATTTESATSLAGSRLFSVRLGAVALDEDSGKLLLANGAGAPLADLFIANRVGQMAIDRNQKKLYITDRNDDKVVVVGYAAGKLAVASSFAVAADPYGTALAEDGKVLLVTGVADNVIAAYSTATGKRLWQRTVAAEPRGVMVSRDGKHALVTSLLFGGATRVELGGSHKMRLISLDEKDTNSQINADTTTDTSRVGHKFARNSFAAVPLSGTFAAISYQVSKPQANTGEREVVGTYGGSSFNPPIEHRITFIDTELEKRQVARAAISAHQPRALAYHGKTDTLYIAGLGNDEIVAVNRVSSPGPALLWKRSLTKSSKRCGPTALAVTADDRVVAFCSYTRSMAFVQGTDNKVVHGRSLANSRLSKVAQLGRQIFHTGGDRKLSGGGAMACASCHPEGRTDGLSWRIEGHSLQTPILAGRVLGTHPFKWDGQDKNIQSSLRNTVKRLGGFGISNKEAKAIEAFLGQMERPRTPTVRDGKAVARGHQLFSSDAVGCNSCHSGAKLTDQQSYDLADDLDDVDTPSLIGLAASAPYYHDGSAPTLRALLRENGTVHGMGKLKQLSDGQIRDLVAYLETL